MGVVAFSSSKFLLSHPHELGHFSQYQRIELPKTLLFRYIEGFMVWQQMMTSELEILVTIKFTGTMYP